MSGNSNGLSAGSPNQVVRGLRSRSARLANLSDTVVSGLGVSLNDDISSSSSIDHPQSLQSHLAHSSSTTGGLAVPHASTDMSIDLQGMYNSTRANHNHHNNNNNNSISHDLAFTSVAQSVSGLPQQQAYSQSNNHNLFPVPVPGSLYSALPPPPPRGRVFQGYTFKDLKIEFGTPRPVDPRQTELHVLRALENLLRNPPALPENTVEELAPKRVFPDYIKLPDDAPQEEQQAAEKINNEIAAESQRVDRERNNEAAKRSRRLKNENLDNANKLLVEKALHIAWLEAQLSAMGGRPEAFDAIDLSVKQRIHDKIVESRESYYEQRKKNKSKRETKKRSEHTKKRALQKRELNERAARQCVAADVTMMMDHDLDNNNINININHHRSSSSILDASSPTSLEEIVLFHDRCHSFNTGPGQQPRRRTDEVDGISLAENGDLDGSFMLMGNEHEWDPCLA